MCSQDENVLSNKGSPNKRVADTRKAQAIYQVAMPVGGGTQHQMRLIQTTEECGYQRGKKQ